MARTSILSTPPGRIRSQSAVGETILPLILGPSTHPLGTLTTDRFPSAICGGSNVAYTVIRYSVWRDVVGPPAWAPKVVVTTNTMKDARHTRSEVFDIILMESSSIIASNS